MRGIITSVHRSQLALTSSASRGTRGSLRSHSILASAWRIFLNLTARPACATMQGFQAGLLLRLSSLTPQARGKASSGNKNLPLAANALAAAAINSMQVVRAGDQHNFPEAGINL